MHHFVRITAANAPYALWLTLRGPVAAWKIELPAWLAGRFERMKPYRIFTRDEWLIAHDAAFDAWKRIAFPIIARRHRAAATIGGRSVDFSRNVWQMLGSEFEALSLFVSMLGKAHAGDAAAPALIEPWIARAFTDTELAALLPDVRLVRSMPNRLLEGCGEWLVSAAHLARTLSIAAGSVLRPRRRMGPRPIMWLGISATEIPDRDDRLNFAWAAQFGYIGKAQVLFFPPCALTGAQRSYLEDRGIAWLEPKASLDPLPAAVRAKVAARSLAGFVLGIFRSSATGAYLARCMARAPLWDALFHELGATTYVTSTSYSWPEKPELALTAARGMRSLIWAYSANSPTFAIGDARFRDLGVVRSLIIAREFWVWNRAYAEWGGRRQVESEYGASEFRVVGPVMCGDPALLQLERGAARARLGLPGAGLCIGVFDMPPMNDAWRDEYGGGPPMISFESYVAFWESIGRLLERVPESFAMVKLKRTFDHPYREIPAVLRDMVRESGDWVRSGRIRVIDVNIDPYLPIAASDVAIGVPYTSPILAARSIGRPAFYLDPLALANHPSCAEYRDLTICTEHDAVAIVAAARDGAAAPATPELPALTPPAPSFPLSNGAGGSRSAEVRRKKNEPLAI